MEKEKSLWKVWFKTDDFIEWDYLVIYSMTKEEALIEAEKIKPNTQFYEVYEAVDCYGFDLKDIADNIHCLG